MPCFLCSLYVIVIQFTLLYKYFSDNIMNSKSH